MIHRGVFAVAVALGLSACSASPEAPTALPAPPTGVSAAVAVAPAIEQEKTLPPVSYEPKGRRDPFEQLEVTGGAKGLTVSSTKLTGIVQSQRGTLALLEGSDGIGYILRPGDTLGDGRLLEVSSDRAVFNVLPRPGAPPTRVTLRLRTDL